MDANRFDALVKTLSLGVARRGMVISLLGGALAPLLASHETAARRHTGRRAHRDDGLSAEKRKKKKCKKCGSCKKCKKGKCKPKADGTPCSGGSCQGGACQPGDQAPPCTDESCPLPPECSQQDFDACSGALVEAIIEDVEACQSVCQDVNSAMCQECLEPIAAARMPEAEACIAESCGLGLQSFRMVGVQGSQRSTREAKEAWFTRTCERPCCFTAYKACQEDAAYQSLLCTAAAIVGTALSGPGGAVAYAFCLIRLAYGLKLCYDRNWCVEGTCIEGDKCCPAGQSGCGNLCCEPGRTCTTGTYNGQPRSACCEPSTDPELTLTLCDGVCCLHRAPIICCPGRSNPCTAPFAGCG
jgi:hypothetical protein